MNFAGKLHLAVSRRSSKMPRLKSPAFETYMLTTSATGLSPVSVLFDCPSIRLDRCDLPGSEILCAIPPADALPHPNLTSDSRPDDSNCSPQFTQIICRFYERYVRYQCSGIDDAASVRFKFFHRIFIRKWRDRCFGPCSPRPSFGRQDCFYGEKTTVCGLSCSSPDRIYFYVYCPIPVTATTGDV